MSYINAKKILPLEVMELIQDYIEGEYIYIPKKEENRKDWGSTTTTKQELLDRNLCIYTAYTDGMSSSQLAEQYFLSIKSIQRIVLNQRKMEEAESS